MIMFVTVKIELDLRCREVVAKHLQIRLLPPDSHLGEQWQQISGPAFWFLSQLSGWVCASRTKRIINLGFQA